MGRSTPSQFVRVRFDEFDLDEADAHLLRHGEPIALAPKPFALLCALVRQAGMLVTKGELLDAVWGHAFVSDSVLKTAINELRTALGDDARHPRYIATVSRRGYRFIGDTSAITSGHLPRENASLEPASRTPPITGRKEELARLRAAWSRACAGHRSVVWVAGDPGVGKTTLVDHFASSLGDTASVRGQCIEQHGAGESYLPVLQGFAELSRRDAAFVELLRAVAPTWLLQLPWLSTPAERETLRGELTGAGQGRMLREGAEVLERYTENRPVLFVTADLHWSDHATVQFMDYVARRRAGARLLWLGSFRLMDILTAEHPLGAVRHELLLHGLGEEIVLDSFSEQEVAEYVAARAPELAADETFVRTLHARTEGLPLFVADVVSEVMAHGPRSASMALPLGLSGIIGRNIRELAPGELRLLEAASVCGLQFRPATVARVLECDATSVAESCTELAWRQRWLSEADGEYAFRHTLYRTVLYQHISPTKRAELHRKVAGALVHEYGGALEVSAAELAFHFEQGGEPETALGYYAEAADAALQRFSPAETMSLTERALSLLSSLDATSARTRLEITLATLQGAAAVQDIGLCSIEAKRAYQRAQSLLDQDPQHPLRGLLLNGLGVVLWMRGELDEAEVLAQRSETLADQTGDATTWLCACLIHGIVQHLRGRPRTARDWLERAIAAAEDLDKTTPPAVFAADPTVVALGLLALQLAHLGLVDQARARVHQAHARARALRTPGPRYAALWFDTWVEMRMGNAQQVADLASQQEALFNEYAFLPHVRPVFLWFRGWAQTRLGDARGGHAHIREGHEQAVRFGLRGLMSEARAYAAEALARSGDWPAARQELDEAMLCAEAIGQRHYLTQLLLLDGQIADGLGEPQRARDSILRAVDEARAQEAPWLELLAMVELCKRDDATVEDCGVLGALIDQLPEASETTAVAKARALLDALNETR